MSDNHLSGASKISKVVSLIDTATGGAVADTVEYLFPDINLTLRGQAALAHDDTVQALVVVARGILSAVHGVSPTGSEVTAFFNGKASDPTFAARTMRLLSQAVRSPTDRRRRMLALALFTPHPDPDTRDRVDAAIEQLEPVDVELLRELVEVRADGFFLGDAHGAPGASSFTAETIAAIPWREPQRYTKFEEAIRCRVASLVRLRSAGCVEIGPPTNGSNMTFQGGWTAIRTLDVFTLGGAVLDVLRNERAFADIEASGR